MPLLGCCQGGGRDLPMPLLVLGPRQFQRGAAKPKKPKTLHWLALLACLARSVRVQIEDN